MPAQSQPPQRRTVIISLLCLVAAAGTVAAAAMSLSGTGPGPEPGDITASLNAVSSDAAQQTGKSTGLPLPRFVTLKADKVNVRRGPSSDHPVAFVFRRKGLPVEITAEFENWRKIRDSDGAEGWILQSMLTGRRNAYVAQWSNARPLPLHENPGSKSAIAARLAPGVLAVIDHCDGRWCAVSAGDFDGYAEQTLLWGVYPGEVID